MELFYGNNNLNISAHNNSDQIKVIISDSHFLFNQLSLIKITKTPQCNEKYSTIISWVNDAIQQATSTPSLEDKLIIVN